MLTASPPYSKPGDESAHLGRYCVPQRRQQAKQCHSASKLMQQTAVRLVRSKQHVEQAAGDDVGSGRIVELRHAERYCMRYIHHVTSRGECATLRSDGWLKPPIARSSAIADRRDLPVTPQKPPAKCSASGNRPTPPAMASASWV